MITLRTPVEALPRRAALAAAALALLAALALAGSGHDKYAAPAAIAACLLPFVGYWVIVMEPAITATLACMLTVFAGNWHYMHVPVPLDRLAWIGVLAALGWRALAGDPRFQRLRFRGVHLVLLLAMAYAISSSVVAGTITNSISIVDLLDQFGLVPFLLFFFAPVLFPGARERNYLLIGFVALGVYLGFTAWAEGLSVNSLVFPRYILNPAIGEHFGRARGPFLEAAGNGLALYVCAMAGLAGMRVWRSRRARVIAGGVALLCISGVIFTLTREAWVGAALGTLLVLVATPELRRYLIPTVGVGLVAILVIVLFVPSFSSKASTRIQDNRSVWDRLNSDSAGLRMVESRPLFGFGWNTYTATVRPYYRLAPSYPLTQIGGIHNEFLANLVSLGVVGTSLWVLAMILGICLPLTRRGPPGPQRLWWSILLGVFVCWLVVANFTPQDYAFANASLWLLAGIAHSLSSRDPVRAGA